MAFSTITTAQIAVKKPTTNGLWTKVKDNFDDHESRIGTLEATTNVFRPLQFNLTSFDHSSYSSASIAGRGTMRLNFDLTITSARMIAMTQGSSGTQTHDIQYKRGAGSFISIFSVLPSIDFNEATFTIDTGTLSVTSLLAGDIVRLLTTSVQAGGWEFLTELEYTI